MSVSSTQEIAVYLIGNPNSGKTSLFNAITGEQRHVGNWPGVTVAHYIGIAKHGDTALEITDLPGTYSTFPFTPEEAVTINTLAAATGGVVCNVVDTTNLQRNLVLTLQLLEIGIRPVIAGNFIDEIRRTGRKLDLAVLSKELGCPIIATDARKGEGKEALLTALVAAAHESAGGVGPPAHDARSGRLPPRWRPETPVSGSANDPPARDGAVGARTQDNTRLSMHRGVGCLNGNPWPAPADLVFLTDLTVFAVDLGPDEAHEIGVFRVDLEAAAFAGV